MPDQLAGCKSGTWLCAYICMCFCDIKIHHVSTSTHSRTHISVIGRTPCRQERQKQWEECITSQAHTHTHTHTQTLQVYLVTNKLSRQSILSHFFLSAARRHWHFRAKAPTPQSWWLWCCAEANHCYWMFVVDFLSRPKQLALIVRGWDGCLKRGVTARVSDHSRALAKTSSDDEQDLKIEDRTWKSWPDVDLREEKQASSWLGSVGNLCEQVWWFSSGSSYRKARPWDTKPTRWQQACPSRSQFHLKNAPGNPIWLAPSPVQQEHPSDQGSHVSCISSRSYTPFANSYLPISYFFRIS